MTALQQQPKPAETLLGREIMYALRYYLFGTRGLVALTAIAVAGGVALNWSWLVAAGLAPLLLSVLPCAAMCALGLCMGRMGRRADASDANSQAVSESCCTPAADEKEPRV